MYYFYKPILEDHFLSEQESHYASRVLRLKEGDRIMAFDGKGNEQELLCTKVHPKKLEVDILENRKIDKKKKGHIHIAIGPTKQMERMEWFIEKCIEMGIAEISFLHCRHSVRNKIKDERIEKVMISAARQSGNMILPKYNGLIPFKQFIAETNVPHKYIANLNDEKQTYLSDVKKEQDNILVMIGPEGDFSEDEIKEALDSGFQSLSLGASRLRTETAGIYSCAVLNHIFNPE